MQSCLVSPSKILKELSIFTEIEYSIVTLVKCWIATIKLFDWPLVAMRTLVAFTICKNPAAPWRRPCIEDCQSQKSVAFWNIGRRCTLRTEIGAWSLLTVMQVGCLLTGVRLFLVTNPSLTVLLVMASNSMPVRK